MKDILEYTGEKYALPNLEYIIEKKESEKELTDFERVLYSVAYSNITTSKANDISLIPVISMSVAFLAITIYRNRNKSLLNIGIRSLIVIDPIIRIATRDLKKGNPPFHSIKKPWLKLVAYLLTAIVTIPMYIAYKIIPHHKMKKFFDNVDKIKNCVINKILSKLSGQEIDYSKIYNDVKQELAKLEDRERIQKILKQKHVILQNDYEIKTKLHKELKSKIEKSRYPLERINTNCMDLSTKAKQMIHKLGDTRSLSI